MPHVLHRIELAVARRGVVVVVGIGFCGLDLVNVASGELADDAGEHFGVPGLEEGAAAVVVVPAGAGEVRQQHRG